jgi:hypothetical protein
MAIAYTPDRSGVHVRDLLIAAAVVMLAVLTLYLVGLDQGAISQSGAFLHELMHDGRHLLGVPCH